MSSSSSSSSLDLLVGDDDGQPPPRLTGSRLGGGGLPNDSGGDDGGLLARRLPSPLDLWRSWTPFSILLLPFVLSIYVLFGLPLHYNSTTENNEWNVRSDAVDDLASELEVVARGLDCVKRDHLEVKDMVGSLRRRLDKIAERRETRMAYLRGMRREEEEEEEEGRQYADDDDDDDDRGGGGGRTAAGPTSTIPHEEKQRRHGEMTALAREGPLTNAGKLNTDDE